MNFDGLNTESIDRLWRFARGDMTVEDFESWIYQSSDLEEELGSDGYLKIISINYKARHQVAVFRHELQDLLPAPASCQCHKLADADAVDWPSDTMTMTEVGGTRWLNRMKCNICGIRWLVAWDDGTPRVYRSVEAPWQEIMSCRELLAAAERAVWRIWCADPLTSAELPTAIRILAEETPGISLSEIVDVLPIDRATARYHAVRVIAKHGVDVSLDS